MDRYRTGTHTSWPDGASASFLILFPIPMLGLLYQRPTTGLGTRSCKDGKATKQVKFREINGILLYGRDSGRYAGAVYIVGLSGGTVSSQDFENEVLRKIGRNVLLFQQLENLLKFMVTNGKIAGYASELDNIIAKQAASINKQTMGQLVGQYIENTNPNYKEKSLEPEQRTELYLSIAFQVGNDSTWCETKKKALAQLVLERNQLIHHLLPKLNTNSVESCKAIEKELDEQSEKIRSEIGEMKAIAKAFSKMAKYLTSEEGKKLLTLSFLRHSPLVLLLGDIFTQRKRKDGWALMSTAGQLVKQYMPEELTLLRKEYGYKSLKSLMLATELFDVYEEETEKGGIRTLYRLKPDWELSQSASTQHSSPVPLEMLD